MKLVNQEQKYFHSAICLIAWCTLAFIYDIDAWMLFSPLIPALLIAHVSFKEQQRNLEADSQKVENTRVESEVFKINKLSVLLDELIGNLLVIKNSYTDEVLELSDYRRTLSVPYLVSLPQGGNVKNDAVVETSFFLRFIPPEQLEVTIDKTEEPFKYIHPAIINEEISMYNRVVFLWHKRNKLYEDSISGAMVDMKAGGEGYLNISSNRVATEVMNYLLIGEECIMHTERLIQNLCKISNAIVSQIAPYYDEYKAVSVLKLAFILPDEGWVTELDKNEKGKILKLPEQHPD